MLKRILPVGTVWFVLAAGFGATCQNLSNSLPDAPSIQKATPAVKPDAFFVEAPSPLEPVAAIDVNPMRANAFAGFPESREKESRTIFDKYLAPGSSKQRPSYQPSGGVLGRGVYAVSRTLVARDDSGKGRLNTSYLVRVLASAAADTASRPYWRRSVGEPFSDLGSTVGNDAGTNLWHEFRPGIEQVMKSHTPRFVSRIEEHIIHN
ncbi:MAG: hypothetical protein WB523_18165 [Candidatus Sulfotelmatobacter sp.]